MAVIMKAKPVIEEMFKNWVPMAKRLYIFTNDNDPASVIYTRNKEKFSKQHGIDCVIVDTDRYSPIDLSDILENLEYGERAIVQLPIADKLKGCEKSIINSIPYYADIDSMTMHSTARFYSQDVPNTRDVPCTPLGVMLMLDYYYGLHSLEGKKAVVIGRSNIVGRPMARELESHNCTVTICHSKTKDIASHTKDADIIICAVGKTKFITADMVKEGAVVVDIGINRDANGKVVGDADYDNLVNKCGFITPVPGGVGPMTVASLVYKMGVKQYL